MTTADRALLLELEARIENRMRDARRSYDQAYEGYRKGDLPEADLEYTHGQLAGLSLAKGIVRGEAQ
ncbi:MAG TPA: hypothetical protein VGO89_02780 [Streptomyces sp.]|jgi:hypothetical protein|nr:hypothetical protein [Streptomyces sp.]